ncbi:MAG: hypothetical protein QXZ17_16075 [Nitrososphaerota archaeon]
MSEEFKFRRMKKTTENIVAVIRESIRKKDHSVVIWLSYGSGIVIALDELNKLEEYETGFSASFKNIYTWVIIRTKDVRIIDIYKRKSPIQTGQVIFE